MANLRYPDKHNMVPFLKKPTKSVGFTEIVDFLKGTSLRYALTHNPTIYDSLIKQFWQTATVRTLANEIQELVASIDNKEYAITEASIRSQLQLADATGEHVPLLPAMLAGVAEDQDRILRVKTEGAATTTSGLDVGVDSGNIHESPLKSHEAPLPEGSAEDSLQLKELMVLVPKLVTRIANWRKRLAINTKTTYGKAVLTLVERVKSLEVAVKRKTKKVESLYGKRYRNIVTPLQISVLMGVQEQDISPTTLEATKTLSHVISQKANSTDKGIRYKRKTRSKLIEKDISTDLDAGIDVNTGS
ncbi:hypothetical protein Tco_1458987 [Tanacetum coccineum]